MGLLLLESDIILEIQNCSHNSISTNINLTQKFTLAISQCTHSLISNVPTLIQKFNLTIQNSFHSVTSPNITLGSSFLNIQKASHAHICNNINLTQKHTLVIQNCFHSLTSPLISLRIHLLISDCLHTHFAPVINLTQKHTLSINPCIHSYISQKCNVYMSFHTVFANSFHALSSTNITLSALKIYTSPRPMNRDCDVCGFSFKNYQLYKRPDGYMVCVDDYDKHLIN